MWASNSTKWGLPVLNEATLQSTLPNVFFGGDAAFGPKNIITAVAHGHEAAVSIDKWLNGEDVAPSARHRCQLVSQKMGIHEWSYDNEVSPDARHKVPWRRGRAGAAPASASRWSWASTAKTACQGGAALPELRRADRVQCAEACIECDACADICPTDCISFVDQRRGGRPARRLKAPAG
jgi:formate dehydrogenase beta subunit